MKPKKIVVFNFEPLSYDFFELSTMFGLETDLFCLNNDEHLEHGICPNILASIFSDGNNLNNDHSKIVRDYITNMVLTQSACDRRIEVCMVEVIQQYYDVTMGLIYDLLDINRENLLNYHRKYEVNKVMSVIYQNNRFKLVGLVTER